MNWLNIHTHTLRSPEYIGCEPIARATWLNVMAYCVEQENGGVIVGAAAWKDRQWQQTCGVTAEEVSGASPLIVLADGDAILWNYPEDKEAEVSAKRTAGKAGGLASGKARREAQLEAESKHSLKQNRSRIEAVLEAPVEAVLERKGIGKEGEEEEKGNGSEAHAPSLREWIAQLALHSVPADYAEAQFDRQDARGWSQIRKWKAQARVVAGWFANDIRSQGGDRPRNKPAAVPSTPESRAAREAEQQRVSDEFAREIQAALLAPERQEGEE